MKITPELRASALHQSKMLDLNHSELSISPKFKTVQHSLGW